ncbi:MAG: toll/interleukin-1 receptor domain-containing protein [Oscillibacter sp.]|nr:toll/interleukin-1 receptor domain-containing protein [Oscillibacter sp.]
MKVYIGWSGETSKEIASILKSWLPLMNPHIEVFNTVDIPTGSAWEHIFFKNLLACDCAIFCFTQDNIHSPWLLYEAGVVSGAEKPIIPLLFDVPLSRLSDPLRFFQPILFTKDHIWQMALTLNDLCGQDAFSYQELAIKFDQLYPTVEKMVEQVRNSQKEQPEQGTEDLKWNLATINNKLDAILSGISMDSYPRQKNSL